MSNVLKKTVSDGASYNRHLLYTVSVQGDDCACVWINPKDDTYTVAVSYKPTLLGFTMAEIDEQLERLTN
jgi:hypothetical protein